MGHGVAIITFMDLDFSAILNVNEAFLNDVVNENPDEYPLQKDQKVFHQVNQPIQIHIF